MLSVALVRAGWLRGGGPCARRSTACGPDRLLHAFMQSVAVEVNFCDVEPASDTSVQASQGARHSPSQPLYV